MVLWQHVQSKQSGLCTTMNHALELPDGEMLRRTFKSGISPNDESLHRTPQSARQRPRRQRSKSFFFASLNAARSLQRQQVLLAAHLLDKFRCCQHFSAETDFAKKCKRRVIRTGINCKNSHKAKLCSYTSRWWGISSVHADLSTRESASRTEGTKTKSWRKKPWDAPQS